MARIYASPGRYIQGYKELGNIRKYVSWFGKNFFIISSRGRMDEIRETIKNSFLETDCSLYFEAFNGECTSEEIDRMLGLLHENKCEGVIGAGGGKVIDTAKAVAFYAKVPIAIVPTVASSDAPTSASSVVYNQNGEFEDVIFLSRNPDIVIMDTCIIANAPSRLLAAGMGDALATYFEARTCVEGYRNNFVSFDGESPLGCTSERIATKASFALAHLCYNLLLEYGREAMLSVKNKVVTKALDCVIEANTLLSGIGFESNGLASAHAIYCGFTGIKGREHMYHGEYVAFGTIAMLVLEGRPRKEIERVIRFCISIGLPVTFEDLNLSNICEEELKTIAEITAQPTQTSISEPFLVRSEEVIAAIKTANELGRIYKNGGSLVVKE